MKKILILAMSCQDEFFLEQEKYIDLTWGKDILEGKYPNISLIKYRGGYDSNKIVDNIMYLNCEDDVENTFKKTFIALSFCEVKFPDVDYIFRVNTSTFVNVPLLNAFVQSLENEDDLWCSELYSLSEKPAPYPLMLYGRGNGLLLSKKIIKIILGEGFSFIYLHHCDDDTIANVLNSFWMKHKVNYDERMHSFQHGWFRCTPNAPDNHHSLCAWDNANCNFDFMKNFITIQIKRYWEREIENQNYIDLYEQCFSKNTDDNIQEAVKKQYEYDKNPNIFIGSILGYMPKNKWKNIDRRSLYDFQSSSKSLDDPSRGKKDILIF